MCKMKKKCLVVFTFIEHINVKDLSKYSKNGYKHCCMVTKLVFQPCGLRFNPAIWHLEQVSLPITSGQLMLCVNLGKQSCVETCYISVTYTLITV